MSILATSLFFIATSIFGYLWYRRRKKNCTVLVAGTIIFGLSIVLSIPFTINELYILGNLTQKGYDTLYEPTDVLSFYGSFLAFVGTVALGALALHQNSAINKISQNQARLSVRPYFFTSIEDENISFMFDNDILYCDLEIESDTITHKGITQSKTEDITLFLEYKKEFEQLSSAGSQSTEKKIELLKKQNEILNILKSRYVLIRYKLTNYGNASAVNVKMLLNNEIFTPLFSISKDSTMVFYLLCDFEKFPFENNKKFEFKFEYLDIKENGPYSQTESFNIAKLENGFLRLSFKEQISGPTLY